MLSIGIPERIGMARTTAPLAGFVRAWCSYQWLSRTCKLNYTDLCQLQCRNEERLANLREFCESHGIEVDA